MFFQDFAQVTFRILSFPKSTNSGDSIFIAGNFNQWNPGLAEYKFKRFPNGNYFLTIKCNGSIEYKFTQGTWSNVELGEQGQSIQNRKSEVHPLDTIDISILNWEIQTDAKLQSTALPEVQILADSFYIPQLGRKSKIWICLPPDYKRSEEKRYPVIYMQDGQNLFDDRIAFKGEWGVDECMRDFYEKGIQNAIIIGIENSSKRMSEYTIWNHKLNGHHPEGDAYVEFLVYTLKPYVDEHFRTLSDPASTGIAGSSLGGFISLYAQLKHPEVFGKAAIFSPSLWISKKKFIRWINKNSIHHPIKMYLIAGEKESETMISDMIQFRNSLINNGVPEESIRLLSKPDGKHNESFWRIEFPDAYLWLFKAL